MSTSTMRLCGLALGLFTAATAQAGTVVAQPGFGEPLNGLTPTELARFFTGKAAYTQQFTAPTGLGPVFNETACGDCHTTGPGGPGTQMVFRAGRTDKGGFDPLEEFGGSLFQLQSISPECAETPPGQANTFTDRVTNGVMGYGLVEAIPDADLQFYEDFPPSANVSGDANLVPAVEDPDTHVGRFGWKAQVATIMTFSADAALQELGITTPFFPQDNDPNGINPPELAECDTVPDPEQGMTFLQELTDFQRFLAPFPQTPRSGMAGEAIFNAIGCADCHVPSFTTADNPNLEDAIRNKVVKPYSDFLLHNMGLNGDGFPINGAEYDEMKTAPLSGVRVRDPMWHDGRFLGNTFPIRVGLAIAAHDDGFGLSEGAASAQAYAALSAAEQNAVIAFLDSLGRREFDRSGDNQVSIIDFAFPASPTSFVSCYGNGPYTPDDPCAIHDVDQDGDVDLDDFDTFLTVYSGALSDCNLNGVLDLIDILNNQKLDADEDGVLDECQPTCPGDTNGDGQVAINDFLQVLSDWGPCPGLPAPCAGDLTGDDVVDILDFLEVLDLWGQCP